MFTNPIINKKVLLKKFASKGGWTYAVLPQIKNANKNSFGWIRVKGKIDAYEFKNYHLMPMANGHLFLPVKASVRKLINKQAGDYVQVVLYKDDLSTEISKELEACFENEPSIYKTFLTYTNSEQKQFIDWVYSAQKDETKIERIVEMFAKIERGEKL